MPSSSHHHSMPLLTSFPPGLLGALCEPLAHPNFLRGSTEARKGSSLRVRGGPRGLGIVDKESLSLGGGDVEKPQTKPCVLQYECYRLLSTQDSTPFEGFLASMLVPLLLEVLHPLLGVLLAFFR